MDTAPEIPFVERRRMAGRRSEDDDTLAPDLLLGYERWAGRVWRRRGTIAAALTLLGTAGGCVVGFLGRAHDLDGVRAQITADSARLAKVEAIQAEQLQNEPLKMQMLCSLTRRIDPLGTPSECGTLQRSHP